MIRLQSLARRRSKAFFALAKPFFELNKTACTPEICSRAAYIVNISLKIGLFCKHFRFFNYRFLASCCNKSALMKSYRTEVTCSEAASIVSYRKFDLFNRRNSTHFFIAGVICPLIRKRVDPIHLLLSERRHRRILHKHFVAVTLLNQLSPYMILLVLLDSAGNGIFFFAVANILKGRTFCAVKGCISDITGVSRSSDIGNGAYRFAVGKSAANFNRLIFAHSVGNKIGLRIKKNASSDFIVPIVIVRKAAKRSFKTADYDRNISVKLPDFIAINNHRSVGS